MYIDSHSHLNLSAFDDDRDNVIKMMRDSGVRTQTIGVDLGSSYRAVELSKQYPDISRAIVGVHPAYIAVDNYQKLIIDLDSITKLATDDVCVGLGECGYDFFHPVLVDGLIEMQDTVFRKQIDIAIQVNKPLMLHLRSKKGELLAYDRAIETLYSYGSSCPRFQTHFYAGSIEQARQFLDMGGYISFTGVVTFTRDYDEIIRYIPIDRILCETDSPYVAPVPHRGTRCNPNYVIEVYKKLAEIQSIDVDIFRQQIQNNVRELWGW
jgi:TatD DNase family protein